MKKKAFTLVEIMAVVALIAVLFMIFIPRIGFAANKTKVVGVQTDFNSYRVAMQTTAMENSGFGGSEAAARTALNSNLDEELHFGGNNKSAAKDSWGNPYEMKYTAADAKNGETISISSLGIDGKEPLNVLCAYENGEVRLETVGTAIGGKPSKPSEPAGINKTVFTYSDGTTQTVDVVGMLAGPYTRDENWNPVGSSYTVPQGAALTGVKIGRHVTTIGNRAFEECTSLTSVPIPDSVTTIGDYAFDSCNSLKSVDIPNSVTTIEGDAFGYCSLTSIKVAPGNPNYKDIDGILFSKDGKTLIQCPGGKSGVYTIPSGVTTIGNKAFYCCDSLTSVNIPSSVTEIGRMAFWLCSSLTSVDIPSSVTTIWETTFGNCSSLTSIKVASDNLNYKDTEGVLFNKDGKTLIQCPGGKSGVYTIPNSVTTIGEDAFGYCSSLTSVTIPSSVTEIGRMAFSSCSSLTSVDIPSSVTTIGEIAFNCCTSLTSIDIPSSVTTIGPSAFYKVPHIEYHGSAPWKSWDKWWGALSMN